MALVAAAAGNKDGMVMRPTIEMGRQPLVMSQGMSPQTAARMRQMMALVVQRGTASGTFGGLLRGKLTAGGKTGTAQRQVNAIDPKTNKPIIYRDARGRAHIKKEFRIDSWFIGVAPAEAPQIAFAVVVEGGGYGAKTSAPIAGNLLLKALKLELLAPQPAPPAQSAQAKKR
jgi:penicillin-binding protein 2